MMSTEVRKALDDLRAKDGKADKSGSASNTKHSPSVQAALDDLRAKGDIQTTKDTPSAESADTEPSKDARARQRHAKRDARVRQQYAEREDSLTLKPPALERAAATLGEAMGGLTGDFNVASGYQSIQNYAAGKVGQGLLSAGEGIADFILTHITDLIPNYDNFRRLYGKLKEENPELSNTVLDKVMEIYGAPAKFALENDITGSYAEALDKAWAKNNPVSKGVDKIHYSMYDTELSPKLNEMRDKYNTYSKKAGDLGAAATQMFATVGAGGALSKATGLGAVGANRAALAVTAGGGATQRAYSEGADIDDAKAYGVLAGALEAGTESISGGISYFGGGATGEILDMVMRNGAAKTAIKTAVGILGEGAEEYIVEYVTPYLQRMVYNPDAADATAEELIEAFAGGAILSGLIQGGQAITGNQGSTRIDSPADTTGFENDAEWNALKTAPETGAVEGSNTRLTENDLAEYLNTGKRLSTRNKKAALVEAGKKPILTTAAEIKSFISDAIHGRVLNEMRGYGKVGSRFAADVKAVNPNVDISNKYLELNADKFRHAYLEHANPKMSGDLPLTDAEFEAVPEYIDHYDEILSVEVYNGQTKIRLAKQNNGYTIILETVSNERNSLHPTNIIKMSTDKFQQKYGKSGMGSRGEVASEPPITTTHTEHTTLAESIIPSTTEKSNRKLEGRRQTPSVITIDNPAIPSGFSQNTLREVAGSFGENGAKAFLYELNAPEYDGSVPIADFHLEFARAYNVGVNGGDFAGLSSEVLSPSQLHLAWASGQNDAKAARAEQSARETEDAAIGETVTEGATPSLFDTSPKGKLPSGVGAASNPFDTQTKESASKKMFADVLDNLNAKVTEYDVETEKQSMVRAAERLDVDMRGEMEDLPNKPSWSGEDLDTAMGVLSQLKTDALKSGDYSEVGKWVKLIKERGTSAGQMIQAFAKYSRTAEGAVVAAAEALDKAGVDNATRYQVLKAVNEFSNILDTADTKDSLVELIKRQAAQRNTNVSRFTENALYAQDITYLRDFAYKQLEHISTDYQKASVGKKISTYQAFSHLFNLKTGLRNVVSNTVFDFVDTIANDVSILPDAIMSIFTGTRTVGLEKSWLSGSKRKGAVQGLKRSSAEVALDVDMGDSTKYQTGRRTNKMVGNAAERVMSRAEKAMGYELNVTDEFSKGSIRGEVRDSLKKFVERGDITQEQADEWANQEALYRTFQDDTLVGSLMYQLKQTMNLVGISDSGKRIRGKTVHEFGLGDLIQKYTQVPGALLTRSVEFSPLGYAKVVKAMYEVARSKKAGTLDLSAQRKAALAIGRASTGTGLIVAFASMFAAGVLNNADDEENLDAKAMKTASGISGIQLNLGALDRWIKGGDTSIQPNDTLVSIEFLEPISALVEIGGYLAQGENVLASSATGVFEAFMATPTMETMASIYDTIRYHDEDDGAPLYLEIPIEIARSSITGFIPGLVRQTAQATDTEMRNWYSNESAAMQVAEALMNSIPGLRQMLPERYDGFGNPIKTEPDALLRTINAYLMPGAVSKVRMDETKMELERLIDETGESVYPDRNPPNKLTSNKIDYNLTEPEKSAFQLARGKKAETLYKSLLSSPYFKSANDALKAELLLDAQSYSYDTAKREYLKGQGVEYDSNTWQTAYELEKNGIKFHEYVKYRGSTEGIESLKNEKGNSISNSSGLQKMEAIYKTGVDNLTPKQRKALFEAFGVGKTVIDYLPAEVNRELAQMRKKAVG